jgi:hypothetical protein
MWHVEDLLRACRFDMDEIEAHIIASYQQPENIRQEIRVWYRDLIDMMRREGVLEKGHLQFLQKVVAELSAIHDRLLHAPHETVYGSLFYQTLPAIVQLRAKAGEHPESEIETCLIAVYGYFLLKMQAKEISNETPDSIKQISRLLAFLADRFHEEEENRSSGMSFQQNQ